VPETSTHVGSDHHQQIDLDVVHRIVERHVDRHRASGLEPGFAYGVVRHGELVLAGGCGEHRLGGDVPDVDTVFRIASMTKSFTAATVLLLRDEGLLRLDDEVARYVPEVAALRPPTDDAPPLVVRSLLTMTAGFPTDDPWGDRQQDLPDDDFAQLLADGLSFAWTPGTAFEYSNLSYALLGRVIAAAAGEPYPDVVTGRLLAPLGLASTGFAADVVPAERLAQGYRRAPVTVDDGVAAWQAEPFAGCGSFAPMGGLFSSVRDLARWVGGLAGAFPPRDGDGDVHPLRRSSRRELQLPHHGLPPLVTWRSIAEPPTVRGTAYGYGLVVERDRLLGAIVSHSGGYPGFGSHMRWHPGSGLGVVALGNATYTPMARLGAQLLDALLTETLHGVDGGVPLVRHVPFGRAGASPGPATGSLIGAAKAARAVVERLLHAWDDDLAARLFATNVDLDEPLEVRRATIERIVAWLGPLEPDPGTEAVSVSPAHCAWWMRGPGGRVRVEIRLSPELPPRVQALSLTTVPEPPAPHRRIAERLAGLLGDLDVRWPADLPSAVALDVATVTRELRAAAAWAGRCRVAQVVACDGHGEAVFRLDGEMCALHLTLTVDEATGTVSAVSIVPVP
jgi:CubicO group peptidase (beta-lactamase class C family)